MNSVILTTMVRIFCSDIDSIDYKNACSSSIEATARQSGVYESVSSWEKQKSQSAQSTAKQYLSDNSVEMAAYALLTANVASGKDVLIRLKKGSFGEDYYLEGSSRDLKVGVGWEF